MKRSMNKKILAIAAILLVLVTAVGVAGAFFSDYDHGVGQATINIGGQTTIDENVQGAQKTISIHNNGGGEVFVRVAIYGPEDKGMTVTAGEGWSKSGDFWYYQNVLPASGDASHTSPIVADISGVPVTVDLSELDIIVTHQSVPAVYDAEGKADMAASWAAAQQ